VVASLDGFIAGPNEEIDWIPMDPDIDFNAIFSQFDAALIGRRTFEAMLKSGQGLLPGMETFVFSRTLRQSEHPKVTVVAKKPEATLAALRAKPGKDIWLFGGGSLFRSLAEAKLVDSVEVTVVPVLLGGGIPLLPQPAKRINLKLESQKVYKTGCVSLLYAIT
jgi:dihydrofolate reductase